MKENEHISIIDPYYTSGEYYQYGSGSNDAAFKVKYLETMLARNDENRALKIRHVADVGCGTGATTVLIRKMLMNQGYDAEIEGYDIHPYVNELPSQDKVTFHQKDFNTQLDKIFDLVVLFDVVEHIPDPIGWLHLVAQHTRLIALHIPLDNSILLGIRNLWQGNLKHPGHLIVLDIPAALNLLSFTGLKTLDYTCSPGFRAPSAQTTKMSKLMFPLRTILWSVSPFILQSTLGGVSLMVLAKTPLGMELNSE
jgi:SAM-dependent methyltransferase